MFLQTGHGQAFFVPIASQDTFVNTSAVKTIQPAIHLNTAYSFAGLGVGQKRSTPLTVVGWEEQHLGSFISLVECGELTPTKRIESRRP